MSDIFPSYANSDLERARPVARALEARGWSVFWDRNIPSGKRWHQVIDENLDAARCVVVLWTEDSVKSDWVYTEAEEGNYRGCLVPALLDHSPRIPLAFRRIQAAGLVDWRGQVAHAGFESLVKAVVGFVGEPARPVPDREGVSSKGAGVDKSPTPTEKPPEGPPEEALDTTQSNSRR